MYRLLNVVLLSILLSGCSVIDALIYKVNIQQGNITEQKHVDKLEIGMTKEQVQFVLGTAMSVDSFDHNRWDYIYTHQGSNEDATRNNLTVFFEDDKLVRFEGEALLQPDKLKSGNDDEDGE